VNPPPDPTDDAVLVRETEERPVVRDSGDNPVVRFRDLERATAQIETKIKVGFAVVGAIGVANLLGIRTADSRLPSTAWHALRTLLAAIT
jgi:hypothetical protein